MTFSTLPTGLDTLYAMLTYKRPHGSASEQAFIDRFICSHIDYIDEFGNLFKLVGDDPTILFSSHTDSVHRESGSQSIEISEDGWVNTTADCLGADCAAGVWLMLEMMQANIPGLYVFHRAEEVGGRGSAHIADITPHLLDGIQAAIAFDRKGFSSIITHQWDGRCCSDAFATSLASILAGRWVLDVGGTFTDTANYVDHVAECTNLSVGYLDQHSSKERLNVFFLEQLRTSLIAADWSKLVIERIPGTGDYKSSRFFDDWEKMIEVVETHPEGVTNLLRSLGYTAYELLTEVS